MLGESLQAFTDAERAWTYLADRETLDGYIRSLEPDRWEDVIASLEAYEDQFRPEHVVPGTIVLLNLLPDIPERRRGIFDMGPRLVVSRVTYRLVRSLNDPAAVGAAVREILPELTSLSSKLELISDVGYREGAGHKLVSEATAAEFEKGWRGEVRTASVDQLAKERDLVRVFLLTKRDADPSEGPLSIEDSPQLTLAFLRAARSDAVSQETGSRAVRRSPRLAWDVLIDLYGDEATLRKRIDGLKATQPEGADDLLELADRYLSGPRPRDFDDD